MTPATFVLDGIAEAQVGEQVTVAGSEGHHAVAVRRIRVGERLTLTDGRGAAALVQVSTVGRGELGAHVLHVSQEPAELPRLVVVQAIPKGARGELAVEMLTEVGADVIVPWVAARSVARWKGERAEKALSKWRATARESAKQARRTWFPEVTEPTETDGVVARLAGASVRVVLHEAASGPLSNIPVPGRGEIVIVVGPEGGITDEELAAFAATGADALRMGSSVLRSSTAGVAAAAALLARTPRWR